MEKIIKSKLRRLIAKNESKLVIELLLKASENLNEPSLIEELVLLSSKLEEFKKRQNLGIAVGLPLLSTT